MIKFCSLSSGSSGNCCFIGTEKTKLLIDAGISGSKTEAILNSFGESCTGISALLITHEHEDHIKAAGILSRRYGIPVYATPGTWSGMCSCKISGENSKIIDMSREYFEIGDIKICPFHIPHDANEPVAYTFYNGEHKLSVATDMGHVTDEIMYRISGSEMILLESNYDCDRLKYGSYPKMLKQRIAGENGHLSNETASEIVLEMARKGTKTFLLGHLSHENNTPALAFETTRKKLGDNGFITDKDVSLNIARRDMPSRVLTF